MGAIKKAIKILAILTVSFVLLFICLTMPTWPSKTKLCQDVESYLPHSECIHLDNSIQIVKQAFPEGAVSSADVKGALGEYLHAEYPTTYGHREVYYISINPIDYVFNYFDSYDFGYDHNGVLISFSYDDF